MDKHIRMDKAFREDITMARIAVDIDGVLAMKLSNGKYPRDYPKKLPIDFAKESLRVLKDKGHYVYLFTARYEEDRNITMAWLHKFGFKDLFDELVMGKPKYDLLIDDRALRFEGNWMDTLYKVDDIERKGWY